MKSIASGNLQGFPTNLITVYVECEIIGEKADMTVLDYILSDAKIQSCGVTEKDVTTMLTEMGFGVSRTAAALGAGVGKQPHKKREREKQRTCARICEIGGSSLVSLCP